MRPSRYDLLLLRLLGALAALLVLNLIMLVVLWVREPDPGFAGGEPSVAGFDDLPSSSPATSTPTSGSSSPSSGPSTEGSCSLRAVLDATIEPLLGAARDFGLDPELILPTEAELEAAVAGGSLDSDSARPVLEKLEAGYQQFNMPFPDLSRSSECGTGPAGPAPPAPEGGSGQAGDTDIIRAFLLVTAERLQIAAQQQDMADKVAPPSAQDIEQAAQAGDLDSAACQALMARMRTDYELLGLDFPEPIF